MGAPPAPVVVPVPAVVPVPVIDPVPVVEPEPAPGPANIPEVLPASGELAVPSCSGWVMPWNVDLSLDTINVDLPTLFSSDSEQEASPLSALGLIPGVRIVTNRGNW